MVSAIRKSPRNSGEEEGDPRPPLRVRPITAPRWTKFALIVALLVSTIALVDQFFDLFQSSVTVDDQSACSGEPVTSELAAIPEKSIAVLPFENLSEDKANAYFADGIQDEILTRLSKIADLKVISRTSTQHYKSAPGKPA